MNEPTYISLIGPADASAEVLDLAGQAGEYIARAGAILVTGGGPGAMEAACRGAKHAGGTTLGLLPGTSRTAGNAFLDIVVPTGMGEMRNVLVVRTGDGVLAVGGGFGTLSEIALALKMGKPLVGIGSWSAQIDGLAAPVPCAGTVAEAMGMLMEALGPGTGYPNTHLG